MDRRIMGVMFGVAAIILWFMPLVAWKDEFLGMSRALHQTGQHIGGIAYLLLAASIAYTALTWFNQHQLRIIAASSYQPSVCSSSWDEHSLGARRPVDRFSF